MSNLVSSTHDFACSHAPSGPFLDLSLTAMGLFCLTTAFPTDAVKVTERGHVGVRLSMVPLKRALRQFPSANDAGLWHPLLPLPQDVGVMFHCRY